MEVEDLFVDLADGVMLLKLLEIISGEKIGKPNGGKMRVHKIENVNKSLAFLHTKVSPICMQRGVCCVFTQIWDTKMCFFCNLILFVWRFHNSGR
jgi:hypothetical protein